MIRVPDKYRPTRSMITFLFINLHNTLSQTQAKPAHDSLWNFNIKLQKPDDLLPITCVYRVVMRCDAGWQTGCFFKENFTEEATLPLLSFFCCCFFVRCLVLYPTSPYLFIKRLSRDVQDREIDIVTMITANRKRGNKLQHCAHYGPSSKIKFELLTHDKPSSHLTLKYDNQRTKYWSN